MKLRPRLTELAEADEAHAKKFTAELAAHYDAMKAFKQLQADKQAIAKLIAGYQQAYNDRDEKAYTALFPPDHAVCALLRVQTLDKQIDPDQWKIVRQEVICIVVNKGQASAYVRAQYRTKAGKLKPAELQGFNAKRDAKESWRLN